jgi:Transcription-silencing protein Clr2
MIVPPPSPVRPVDSSDASPSAAKGEQESYSLRPRPTQAPTVVTQTRYQGLWLGAERIWTDDLVRLKAARGQIAPQGSPQISPPSGPSKSTIAELRLDHETDQEVLKSHGARDRGVFMQLEALFVVDVPDASGAGVHAECRASGMLYELADEDWEEPALSEPGVDTGNGEVVNAQDAWAAAGLSTPPRRRNPGTLPELHVGQPFMSAPSPLKQAPQPNQDPIVPMLGPINAGPTASASTPTRERNKLKTAVAAASTRLDEDSPNAQLSHPTKANAVPLPPAPRGFRFRPILPEGFEVVVSLALVSGRYYPRLLAHPMLRPIVRDMQGNANEAAARLDGHHLFALEGILPGFFNASEATRWKPGRPAMVRDAAAERSAGLARVWDVKRQQAQEAASSGTADAGADADAAEPSQSQRGDEDTTRMNGLEPLAGTAVDVSSTSADLQAAPPAQAQAQSVTAI